MEIKLDDMVEGARRAEGTAVIVDIFRATSLMATLFGMGAKEIYPTTELDEARKRRDELGERLGQKVYMVGECKGVTTDDFDIANTPITAFRKYSQGELKGKTIVGSSTNGYKGLLESEKADEIITSSFLNADATLAYLKEKQPDLVTIIGMGEFGEPSDEDTMFCEFLKARLEDRRYDDQELREYLRDCKTAKIMRDHFGGWVQEDINFCLDPERSYDVVPLLEGGRIIDASNHRRR